jgi:hypothetical protein
VSKQSICTWLAASRMALALPAKDKANAGRAHRIEAPGRGEFWRGDQRLPLRHFFWEILRGLRWRGLPSRETESIGLGGLPTRPLP